METNIFFERLVYVLGVYQSFMTVFLLGYNPYYAKLFHLAKLCIFLPYRLYSFKQKNQHYYMTEFCYYVNLLIIIYLTCDLFTEIPSDYLFLAVYGLAAGPLALAVFVNNDRLYFHSPSHLISVMIHLSPAMLAWRLRWADDYIELHPPVTGFYGLLDSIAGFHRIILPIYSVWFIGYYIFMFINHDKIIEEDIDTMLKYIQSRSGHNAKKFFSEEYSYVNQIVYMIIHHISSLIGITISAILFNSYRLNTVILFMVITAAIWNSSFKYIKLLMDHEKQKLDDVKKDE